MKTRRYAHEDQHALAVPIGPGDDSLALRLRMGGTTIQPGREGIKYIVLTGRC